MLSWDEVQAEDSRHARVTRWTSVETVANTEFAPFSVQQPLFRDRR